MRRKRLSALMQFAIRQGMATTNPVIATKPYKIDSDGFHTWTEDEIAAYEKRHPIGTTARLALDLMLWTGPRGGDARVMGPQNIRSKRLVVTQRSEKRRGGKEGVRTCRSRWAPSHSKKKNRV